MIVTRAWLNEWIDLDEVSTQKLCETFNAIGLEVDSLTKIRIPQKVVAGKVLSCEKHPDADKLSVCQVDIGSETVQIVCGAKNVAAGQWVPVATIGAVLGEDFKIKKAKLRGVASSGMICSSLEIGLPKIEEGIMVLDESIGLLEAGRALVEYPLLNDDVIDIELTANRGDCLSIHGVARDLSAALNLPLKQKDLSYVMDRRGVARVLALEVRAPYEAALQYRFAETKEIKNSALERFRLALIESLTSIPLQNLLNYAMHESGVLLRAYDFDLLISNEREPVKLIAKESEAGLEALYSPEGELLSVVGVMQSDRAAIHKETKRAILEAAYIDPDLLATKKMGAKIESDALYYRASRGSEPDLNRGMALLGMMISAHGGSLYRGSQNHIPDYEPRRIDLPYAFIDRFIGMQIPPNRSVQILKRLGFGLKSEEDRLILEVPPYRHDIRNRQDVVEEIVRMVGIDHIDAKPLCFVEKRRRNAVTDLIEKRRKYRQKAAALGFFESVHYFFEQRSMLEKYGFEVLPKERALSNPITSELDTLRSTLLLHLMRSAGKNIKNGYRSVALFEVGRVVDSQRREREKIAFIFSAEAEAPSVKNHGKPPMIDLLTFAERIGKVVGEMRLEPAESESALINPFEYADVMIGERRAGFLARLHPEAEKTFDLPKSYICELDFALLPAKKVEVEPFSRYPALTRDLSLMVPDSLPYAEIRAHLEKHKPALLKRFYPIDRFEDAAFGERYNMTLRCLLQSDEKTLEEEEINSVMEEILKTLESLGVTLR
ncbi:MAG: phenylalanine--tRNA ligase subunit beta [Campylobacteraceae bacterium 4484_4]|nr:MAG: phenylalanine--tRNA ligase subunit beta [Campylobacteraceae bacterium 4484_4]